MKLTNETSQPNFIDTGYLYEISILFFPVTLINVMGVVQSFRNRAQEYLNMYFPYATSKYSFIILNAEKTGTTNCFRSSLYMPCMAS